jgi:NADP-dependent 3-hydroxy acid dehydrogenase YdfG
MSKVNVVSVENKVVLITGANRGIGQALVREVIAKGARKVYAGARHLNKLTPLIEEFGDKLVPVQLDVTNDDDIENLPKIASDVEVLINNAGVFAQGSYTTGGVVKGLEENFAVNVFGVVKVIQTLLPSLKEKPSAAIATVSSLVGLASMPMGLSYSASKAAVHSIIQGLRGELKETNILVSGIYPGPIDTQMIADFEMEKDSPVNVAKAVVEGLAQGQEDIYPDAMSREVGAVYSTNPKQAEIIFSDFTA